MVSTSAIESLRNQMTGGNDRSIAERIADGKALRQKVKRSELGVYEPPAQREDPIAILESQSTTRIRELIPLRYARMSSSPFTFLRGAAAVMIRDIAPAPTSSITVQACGDMHISNFGLFASAERNLIFGINDFDETYVGAWEWDLKRLVASAVVAGRYLGGDRNLCEEAVRSTVQSYRLHMHEYAEMGYLDLWYANISDDAIHQKLLEESQKAAAQIFAKARQNTHLQILEKTTNLIDEQHHLLENPPLIVRVDRLPIEQPIAQLIDELLQNYLTSLSGDRRYLLSRYRIVDIARKVVGVGSVGNRCWIVYLEGKDIDDPLFLQLKQANPSILAPYAEALCNYRLSDHHQGHRVVIGQRLIQGAPDIFLGWGTMDGVDYYIRQLRDMKGGVKLEPGKFRPSKLPDYCSLCGWALALAHAKSGDAAMLAGYIGKSETLDDALVNFARAYADQTERDFDQLIAAINEGRIPTASHPAQENRV